MRQFFDVQYQVIAYIERARAAKSSWTKTVTGYHTEVAFRELAKEWSKEAFESMSDQERESEDWAGLVDDFCDKQVSKMFAKYKNTAFTIVQGGILQALIVPVGHEVSQCTVVDWDLRGKDEAALLSLQIESLLKARTHKYALL